MRTKVATAVILLIVTLSQRTDLVDASQEGSNQSTGLPPSSQTSPYFHTHSTSTGANILWDLTNGIYFGYEPSRDYSRFDSMATAMGHSITTTTDIGAVSLEQYDVLVICLASAWDSTYSAGDSLRILNFVKNGGNLLIMGDNPGCPNRNINPIANAFGIDFYEYLKPVKVDTFNTFLPHPLFDDVHMLYYISTGNITATAPAREIAWAKSATGDSAARVAIVDEYGFGRVVAAADINFCENTYLNRNDNAKFAKNIITWLTENITVVEDNRSIPSQHRLYPSYPNPFNPVTTIRYDLSQTSYVQIRVFNALGEAVNTLADCQLPGGSYEVQWDGRDANGNIVSSGLFIVEMKMNNFIRRNKITFLR